MRAERELDAAGISDPDLRAGYLECRRLTEHHGRTYFLATRLLPAARRPAVHALYGFARVADDLVDSVGSGRDRRLDALERQLFAALDGRPAEHPVIAAVVDTARRYDLDRDHFREFLTSMRMDLSVTEYPTMADLEVYMRGSAEVIGLQLLPVLGTRVPREEAEPAAKALGTAFQLTNFLRDVGEDLDRGRIYLPGDTLAAHGVDRQLLTRSRLEGVTHWRIKAVIADLVEHTRKVYRIAAEGIPLLARRSRPCVQTAYRLYGGILDLIERCDYDVLNQRVVVPRRRRLAVALPALARVAALGLARAD